MKPGWSARTIAAVAAGGIAGGLLRMLVLAAWPPAGGQLSLALLVINAGGSALIGLVLAFSEPGRRRSLPPSWSLGLMAGFCGALTTFSTFAVELLAMEFRAGVFNLLVSLSCWLAAAALGLAFGRILNPLAEGRSDNP